MKLAVSITVLLIFFFTLDGYSQTVTLSGIDMPLKRVLNTIKSQTGYIFFYEEKLMKEARPVTIGVKNAPVEKVLNQIFEEQPLTWLLEDRTITINRKPAQAITPQATNADQTYRIIGTVKDPEGGPVDAASVTIKGTGRGTITNENGVFSMEARRGSVLVVSSVSYGKKEIRVKDPSPVIQFDLDARPMEKMVIGGNIMPIQRKATVASIAVIDRKTLESQHSQSIDLIYRGVVAGTNHIQAGYETPQYNYFSGTVSIRGISDFSGYGILKVYVDGVQFAAGSYLLNTLDKNSIDHIEVVKGPSSSMLYGSRADGGVLLIYTKKPALNTTNISLTSSAGWYDSKWQDKKPFRQLHAFTVSQGFENVSYMLAGDFNKYETYMPGGRQNRYSLFGKVAYSKDKLDVILSGQHYDNSYTPERNAFFDTSTNDYFNRPGYKLPDSAQGEVKSNVLSASLNYRANRWWTHNLVAGWSDGFAGRESLLKNPTSLRLEIGARGPSLRYYNTIHIKSKSWFSANMLTGVEHANLLRNLYSVAKSGANLIITDTDTSDLQKNTGLFAQFNPAYKDKIFLTLAGRYEINKAFGSVFTSRIGATTNFRLGGLTLKPRVAWGRSINEITVPGTANTPANFEANPDLNPPQQSGWDYAVEGYLQSGAASFEISRYDNIWEDGIYAKQISMAPNLRFRNVNGGKVRNHGWDFSASLKLKGFSISATYTIMNSILQEPLGDSVSIKDRTYPGEQMFFIPKNAAGFIIGYSFPKLFGEADQLSITTQLTYTSSAYTLDGVKVIYEQNINRDLSNLINYGLRYYRTELLPTTKIYLNLDYKIMKELVFFMQLSNITDNTNPDYNSIFPTNGRGYMFGLKYNFSSSNP